MLKLLCDRAIVCASFAILILIGSRSDAQVKPEVVLSYRPSQPDIEIDTPTPDEVDQCELKVEGDAKRSGWALYDPNGQILRRFMDTDGDSKVDEFKYFRYGLEVFRDTDTDGDNKIDQSRWFNTSGTRWGIDTDQDGKIDRWKIISAEEATREAIMAMATGDPARLQAVFINEGDIQSLGLNAEISKKFLANRTSLAAQMQGVLANSKTISSNTVWGRFDSSMLMPNLVPADSGKATTDLTVYENVMAIVKNGEENGFVQIGEMVRVGSAWKLTTCPRPLEGDQFEVSEGGVLLQPNIPGMSPGGQEGITTEMRNLVEQLRKLDANSPGVSSGREEMTRFNVARAELLKQLAEVSPSAEDKTLWNRQRLELVAAATQMQTFPNGLEALDEAIEELRENRNDRQLLAYAVFQRLLVGYDMQLQTASNEERAEVQQNWLKSLERFVQEFPNAPESADALLQLAITTEFNGNIKDARGWYAKLVQEYGDTQPGQRGRGALRRLALEGEPLVLSGNRFGGGKPVDLSEYRGRVTAVLFWATWCKPCTDDLPQLQALVKEYGRNGFSVVGVNLDSPGADVAGYIKNYKVSWPNIAEEGGLESRPAVEYGIFSLPTMFVVDKTGKVVANHASIDELKKLVPELLSR